jgi:hypothetical protein
VSPGEASGRRKMPPSSRGLDRCRALLENTLLISVQGCSSQASQNVEGGGDRAPPASATCSLRSRSASWSRMRCPDASTGARGSAPSNTFSRSDGCCLASTHAQDADTARRILVGVGRLEDSAARAVQWAPKRQPGGLSAFPVNARVGAESEELPPETAVAEIRADGRTELHPRVSGAHRLFGLGTPVGAG